MKKITQVITASFIAASMLAGTAMAASFTDIDGVQYSWAKDYIESMADKGFINGYEDGSFKPDKEVTNLEGIALFARAMGALNEVNEEILEMAHKKYDEVINSYDLAWGHDEIAYMMYKGALKKSDLDTYIAGGRANEPMKRYEASIIITKAMGGEAQATAQTGVVLNYNDKNDIPSNAIQYVYYASKQGIMEGMDNGGFSPLTSVLRSQMAVMLSRVVDKTDYSFVNVHITDVDDTTVTVINAEGDDEVYTVTENTTFKVKGESVQLADMLTDAEAILTLSGNNLVCVDTVVSAPNETITGKFSGKKLVKDVTTIMITPSGSSQMLTYPCASDVTVTYQGSPATLASFTMNDTMTISVVDGEVVSVVGAQKTTTVSNAVVDSLNIEDDFTITITHADSLYDGMSYTVSDRAIIMKDGVIVELSKIYKGDRVNLTLEYGEITKLTATSTTKSVEGTIKEIRIATQSSIIVTVNGDDKEYVVPNDATMMRDGETVDLHSFRVGDLVSIVLESEAIKKITTTSVVNEDGSIVGTVDTINTSFGFINVIPTGSTAAQTVFYHRNKINVFNKQGKVETIDSLKKGDTVYVTGTLSNGAFTATVIIITAEAE